MFIDTPNAIHLLQEIYKVLETEIDRSDLFCRKGCSHCCTQSVTMTALEGILLKYFLVNNSLCYDFSAIKLDCRSSSFTTNQYVEYFLTRTGCGDEDEAPWSTQPCPFLRDNICSVYSVRPAMCRGFVSQVDCGTNGFAQVEPYVLTFNTIVQQLVEHLSFGEPWGLLIEIMQDISLSESKQAGRAQLNSCKKIPGLIVPPEERLLLVERLGKMKGAIEQSYGDLPEVAELLGHFKI